MEWWDPIGVHHFPEDDKVRELNRESYWDEYDQYMPAILRELVRGTDVAWLAQYLGCRRTGEMGLAARPHLDARAAQAIIDWNPKRPT